MEPQWIRGDVGDDSVELRLELLRQRGLGFLTVIGKHAAELPLDQPMEGQPHRYALMGRFSSSQLMAAPGS
jgi:hypothetical protein